MSIKRSKRRHGWWTRSWKTNYFSLSLVLIAEYMIDVSDVFYLEVLHKIRYLSVMVEQLVQSIFILTWLDRSL